MHDPCRQTIIWVLTEERIDVRLPRGWQSQKKWGPL